jgi:hypothetical protein
MFIESHRRILFLWVMILSFQSDLMIKEWAILHIFEADFIYTYFFRSLRNGPEYRNSRIAECWEIDVI